MQIPNKEEIEQRKQLEKLKQEVFSKYLTKEARERLGNLRYAHPELVENVENMLLQSALSDRLKGIIDDAKLKELLNVLSGTKKEGKIKFDRKV
jgi:DNA-binding TFAR19-related protein (PDSD5 family)